MGTYQIEFEDGTTGLVEHVKRVELYGDKFYFILRDKHVTFHKDLVKGFGLISFDEE